MIMKEVLAFRIVFEQVWKECLGTIEFEEISAHQFSLGNRLRPTLFFMGVGFDQKDKKYKEIAQLSCSLELIHKASVMFDDYIDEDELRNGKEAFHKQYQNINKMILLGCTMLGQAGINWAQNIDSFCCGQKQALKSSQYLYEIIKHLCTGCYKELSLPGYRKQNEAMINNITYDETVFLIQMSLKLGYLVGHADIDKDESEYIDILGKNFGYIFQWLNDIEPYSKPEQYLRHKGDKEIHFDYGKKNIALLELYNLATQQEKSDIDKGNISYSSILGIFDKYKIEEHILLRVNEKCKEIRNILKKLNDIDSKWVKTFQWLFDEALRKKEWMGQVENIHFDE